MHLDVLSLYYILTLSGVLLSEDGLDEMDVAVKVPRVFISGQDCLSNDKVQEFVREAQITMTLKHENILSCLGVTLGT